VTLLVSAGLLLVGAVMALRLPLVMQCEEGGGGVPSPREPERSRVSV
jgi:MFS transporter, DHA2 family, multidrug resistance protein